MDLNTVLRADLVTMAAVRRMTAIRPTTVVLDPPRNVNHHHHQRRFLPHQSIDHPHLPNPWTSNLPQKSARRAKRLQVCLALPLQLSLPTQLPPLPPPPPRPPPSPPPPPRQPPPRKQKQKENLSLLILLPFSKW